MAKLTGILNQWRSYNDTITILLRILGNPARSIPSHSSRKRQPTMTLLTPLEAWLLDNGFWSAIPGYYSNGKYCVTKIDAQWVIKDDESMPIDAGTADYVLQEIQKLCRAK